jgi:hypothetical protein
VWIFIDVVVGSKMILMLVTCILVGAVFSISLSHLLILLWGWQRSKLAMAAQSNVIGCALCLYFRIWNPGSISFVGRAQGELNMPGPGTCCKG